MLRDVDAALFQKHTASFLAKVKSDIITSQHDAVWWWDCRSNTLPTPHSRREDLYMNLYKIEKSTKNGRLSQEKKIPRKENKYL